MKTYQRTTRIVKSTYCVPKGNHRVFATHPIKCFGLVNIDKEITCEAAKGWTGKFQR